MATTNKNKRKRYPADFSISDLKKKAWGLLSKAIRLEARGHDDLVTCVTCGDRREHKGMQCGHFIPSRRNSILFDERNIHPQCYICNCRKQGQPVEYRQFMLEKYGLEVIEEIERNKNVELHFEKEELVARIKRYKQRIADAHYREAPGETSENDK